MHKARSASLYDCAIFLSLWKCLLLCMNASVSVWKLLNCMKGSFPSLYKRVCFFVWKFLFLCMKTSVTMNESLYLYMKCPCFFVEAFNCLCMRTSVSITIWKPPFLVFLWKPLLLISVWMPLLLISLWSLYSLCESLCFSVWKSLLPCVKASACLCKSLCFSVWKLTLICTKTAAVSLRAWVSLFHDAFFSVCVKASIFLGKLLCVKDFFFLCVKARLHERKIQL